MSNPGASSWKSATGGAFFDNPSNSSIIGKDGATYGGSLVAKKHNTVSWFADVTAQPNFLSNERSISGIGNDVDGNPIPYSFPNNTASGINNWTSTGNWDAALQAYADTNHITAWWNNKPWTQDQFLQDLKAGDVANYSVIVPDQDDDMHNIGTQPRADYWANNVIAKIQSSSIWKDPTKRVAIVVTFDEGESASTACCGWNPKRSGDGLAQPLAVDANGAVSVTSGISGLAAHDGLQRRVQHCQSWPRRDHVRRADQPAGAGNAPHGHYDTDYYSHFSFVRTMQDMFGLADPGQPGTYMNRSKYTENFIQQNATLLPEFATPPIRTSMRFGPMNHVYQFPAGVAHVVAAGAGTPPTTVGPDADQVNLWATK